jgi:hypothetical protein
MIYLKVLFVIIWIWVAYEIWRAPLMEETDDGRMVTKRPARKLTDLFKNKHNPTSSFSDLEKRGRGRSKY